MASVASRGATAATSRSRREARLLERIPWISGDGMAIVRHGRCPRIVWANPSLHTILYAPPASLVGLALSELPATELEAESTGASVDLASLLDERRSVTTVTVSRTDSSTVTVEVTATPLEATPDGCWLLTVREVTAQLRADALLRSSEERFRALATHAPIGVALSDVGVRLGYVNARFAEIWGEPSSAVLGDGWLSAVLDDDRGPLVEALVDVLAGAEQRTQIRVVRPDGEVRWIDARLTPVRFVGHGAGFVASMEDVTEARDREHRLEWQALHDSLTGLPNRMAFRLKVDEALGRGRNDSVALLFFDLDDFKLVNDTLGHQSGDVLLMEVAERFRSHVRGDDVVARLGGDEFVVLCPDVADEAEALRVAERLLDGLKAPFVLDGTELRVSASVGVVLAQDTSQADDLLRDADVAMYQAKNDGKARTAIFEETHRLALQARLELVTSLRAALAAGSVGLHYQPIVHLGTGRIAGAEALLRFVDPVQGPVPAGDVVALAEETGCIVELGRVVLRIATRQLATWRRAGMGPDYVGVNFSARQFSEPDLLDTVTTALREAGLCPSDLCIELTEGHLIADDAVARTNLAGLQAMGVQLAIDDFGAGYSSLSYLRRIPARTIKIDSSFIRDVDCDPEGAAIVQAVTAMGGALGRQVIAEGVETAEQLQAVLALGCDSVQGYLLGRPVAPRDFPAEVQMP